MAVFHLKYRPKKINELDLLEVADKIKSIVSNESDFQSLLLAGPKGSGKTSAARILAKVVNCLNLQKGEPCGECANCLEIEKGNSLDIMEIDAASNRGIDDIRALKENAYLSPIKLKKKIFIIDEVHMLTKEAFNALLKLIEEPPKNTLFILCTTDAQKIPETVLSRLMKIDFRKGKKGELKNSLEKIVKGEKIEISDEAKEIIIKNSDGSFRNLQKTFNEIYLQFGKKITEKNVKEYFEKGRGEYGAEELETDLTEGKVKEILDKLEKMAEKGVDFGELRLRWLKYFHERMLFEIENAEIKRYLEILIKAGEWEKLVEIEQLPLELAVMEMGGKVSYQSSVTSDELKKKPDFVKSFVEAKEERKDPVIILNKVDNNSGEDEIKNMVKVELTEVEEKWPEVLLAVKPYNHSVEAFLRAARPKKATEKGLVIEVFYKFHKEKLEEAKNRQIVEIGLEKVFGGKVNFECVLADVERKKEMPLKVVDKVEEKIVSETEIYDVAKDIFG
jgi:DNA polymerase-3 subunit gamma/tau